MITRTLRTSLAFRSFHIFWYSAIAILSGFIHSPWVLADTAPIKFAPVKYYKIGFGFYTPSIESEGAATADLDNDGNNDVVVVAPWYGNKINIMWGKGNGKFKSPAQTQRVGLLNSNVILGDYNSDGLIDFAVSGTSSFTIVINQGNRKFSNGKTYLLQQSPAQNSGFSADVNGDGILDLVLRSFIGIHSMLGNGDGSFSYGPTNLVPGTIITSITSIDSANLNNDNITDLVLTDAVAAKVIGLAGTGDGRFEVINERKVHGFPSTVIAGDLDHTGLDSVVALAELAPSDKSVAVLLNDGTGSLETPSLYNGGFGNPNGLLADFNGDGHLDILSMKVSSSKIVGQVKLLAGEGDGTFTPAGTHDVGIHPQTPLAADFNGDSKLDIALPATCPLLLGGLFGNVCLAVLLNKS